MGRWLDRLRKAPDGIPTKPTKPDSVSFVSIPSGSSQEITPLELVAVAANDHQRNAWLKLLVLADGRVIQHCSDLAAADLEQGARQRYGGNLLAVVGAPDYQRPLVESEIVKALAGTLASPLSTPPPSSAWLVRVARLLGVQPSELLDGGHLEPHDLTELAGTDPRQVAALIRTHPAWPAAHAQP